MMTDRQSRFSSPALPASSAARCAVTSRAQGYDVHGVDNNQRAVFFGPQGDTRWNQQRLERELPPYRHHELDIRDRQGVLDLVARTAPVGDRARGRAAVPRPRGRHPLRRLRHQRRRHAELARGGAAQLSREPVRLHEHQQGVRRRAEPDRARRAGDALGLRRPASTRMAFRRRSRSTRACTACSAPARSPPT